MKWVYRITTLIAMIAVFTLAWIDHAEHRRFKNEGRVAQVDAIDGMYDRITKHSRMGITTSTDTTHIATVRFVTEQGKAIKISRSLPKDVFEATTKEAPISIIYLPDNPTMTKFASQKDESYQLGLFGLLLVGALILFFKYE
jgi:hypothetical protein